MNLATLIRQLGDHITAGPVVVSPQNDNDGDWLVKYMTMSQFVPGKDPIETIMLYVPAPECSPSKLLPVIRRTSWGRLADFARARRGSIREPDISVIFYKLLTDDLAELDRHIRELDESLSEIKFDVEGLSYVPDPPGPSEYSPDFVWYLRGLERWTGGFTVNLTFSSLVGPYPNAAWERLWLALESICQPSRRIECGEDYWIDPQTYGKLLRAADT